MFASGPETADHSDSVVAESKNDGLQNQFGICFILV